MLTLLSREQDLSPFRIFVIVYVTAFLLEMVEFWPYPIATSFSWRSVFFCS